MFFNVLLLGNAGSVAEFDPKSEREEEGKSDRLRTGVASENATRRGVARGGCLLGGSELSAVLSTSPDLDDT